MSNIKQNPFIAMTG